MTNNKIALVTGSSRGLGKNTALALAKKGVGVVVTYHSNLEEAKSVVSDIEASGAKAAALQLDTSNIAPGAIETDFGGGAVRDNPEMNQAIASQTALGRAGVPDDIGGAIAALLSEDNRWITGQRIEVSGGQSL